MTFAIPLALWSDRLGSRRTALMAGALMVIAGVGLLSIAGDAMVWVAVVIAGLVRDGFMAIFMTTIIETKGVGPAYAGTAIGLTMAFSGLGNLIAPPLGNSLAGLAPGIPFVFWAGLAVMGLLGLYLAKESHP
jgi:MFS family permease